MEDFLADHIDLMHDGLWRIITRIREAAQSRSYSTVTVIYKEDMIDLVACAPSLLVNSTCQEQRE